jgi:hypothetical protein
VQLVWRLLRTGYAEPPDVAPDFAPHFASRCRAAGGPLHHARGVRRTCAASLSPFDVHLRGGMVGGEAVCTYPVSRYISAA